MSLLRLKGKRIKVKGVASLLIQMLIASTNKKSGKAWWQCKRETFYLSPLKLSPQNLQVPISAVSTSSHSEQRS
jgi:hypothetical protein